MADTESVVRLEEAVSARSTCRATGEAIAKGELRVGLEVWLAGRMSWSWQKPLPYLERCYVEYVLHSGNCGACRKTGHKFQQGEPRFVCTSGDKKVLLSLGAAGEELRPVLAAVGARHFKPTQFKGVEELAEQDREAFFQAFQVSKSERVRYNKAHPPPAERPEPEARPAKKARTSPPSGAAKQRQQQQQGEEEEEGKCGDGVEVGAEVEAAAVEGGLEGGEGEEGLAAEGMTDEVTEGMTEGMTEYERQRAERIRLNRERMAALQLPALAAQLQQERPSKPRPPPAQKGISARKQRLSEAALPRRQSLRVQGMAPDGSQVHSERRGEIIVVSGEAIRYNPALVEKEAAAPSERHLKGELPFKSTSGSAASDAAFVELLSRAAAAAVPAAGSKAKHPGAAQIGRLKLAETDVAKVTKGGVTHLAFHPTADTLLLACGDKYGNLGLWHVDYDAAAAGAAGAAGTAGTAAAEEEAEGREGEVAAAGEAAVALDSSEEDGERGGSEGGGRAAAASEFDGVLQLKHHLEYISGLRWVGTGASGSGSATQLLTASYDGSLRALDLAGGGRSLLAFGDEECEFSAMDATSDGRTALLGDNEGEVHLLDLRAGTRSLPAAAVHTRKVNTVHFEPVAEQLVVTASTDSCIHLWDVRKLGGKKWHLLATAQHRQTCQAAYFAPDGSRRVASTSFDDTVRVWDAASGLKQLVQARHDNQTGRWVFPFRAVWGPSADCLIIGNMKRFVDVLGASGGELEHQLSSEHMTAIAARNCAHPTLPALAAATASGRAHVYR